MSDEPAVPGSAPLIGRALVPGTAEGAVLYSSEPLSFWGGYDADTGEIIDRRHPLAGRTGTGSIMAIPATRGSSTTTAVLLEAIRRGTAPAAFLTRGPDTFLALAAIVADQLYGRAPPVIALSREDYDTLRGILGARVDATGAVRPLQGTDRRQ
ncbi:aconitase X swivel domain-containing protein [Candidatus Palauibacter sp.]|uniref:aconitase X swivel domain-containing protein n=1 Tax=Candidatus Palauibacter sp. TaxID=3101350 RepID=UPI003B51A09F